MPSADAATANETGTNGDSVVGRFIVELIAGRNGAPGYTNVGGKVSDGPSPSTVAWDRVESIEGCQLSKPRAPFCNPSCGSGKLCADDNRCVGYPTAQDVGPLNVTGLGMDFAMTAIAKSYQAPGDVTLPFPPAAEGSEVQVAATQGGFGPFTLAARMVAPLTTMGVVKMESGKPIVLTWTPPGKPDVATIAVEVDISHHGGTKGLIECDVADDGELEIPASLVSKLIDLGVAGFPSVTMTRHSEGSARVTAGIVQLSVISSVTREAEVSGFVSCSESIPCPDSKVCLQNGTCAP